MSLEQNWPFKSVPDLVEEIAAHGLWFEAFAAGTVITDEIHMLHATQVTLLTDIARAQAAYIHQIVALFVGHMSDNEKTDFLTIIGITPSPETIQ